MTDVSPTRERGLTPSQRDRFDKLRRTRSLAELADVTAADGEHAAYLAAKREWRTLQERRLDPTPEPGVPGTTVAVGDREFHVHGITHADTDAERSFLREHVADFLDSGASVYCEQGIWRMYFADFDRPREMDDYRWAMERCRELDVDSHLDELPGNFEGLLEDVDSFTGEFKAAVFSLVEDGSDVYGETFERTLGDLASDFLTSHEGLATGDDYESFKLTRRAATDPTHLVDLQHYYRTTFLPQPLEREWLRRHDPELELMTHARNERMADYGMYHASPGDTVHLLVGAAHQPGIEYYLDRFDAGERTLEGFELTE
ncbi:hypothetical protein [Haloarchaeobius baliensis]|uniref:hypothetical protein n=1 Tax=Haloarchaeobius baliensis TaxID=1670458 RepID=UPI003F880953